MSHKSKFRYSLLGQWARRAHRLFRPVPKSPWTHGKIDDIANVHLVPPEKLVSFFDDCIEKLRSLKGDEIGDYLEFGVFNGSSIGSMHIAREKASLREKMRLVGFDAFQGLPPGSEDVDGGVWQAGFYACCYEEMCRCLRQRDIAPEDMVWIKGWYDETLTDSLAERFDFQNVGIVFIDCDTYPSAKTVLDFLASYIKTPVIMCFDDWKLNDLDIKGDGEYRAFNEFLEANPYLKAREIPSYNRKSKSFIIEPV